ncbi:hypothetical protein [Candidatus Leptofilum sp.]|uniref:hypothetical protein n=1 Tax=Candidatus Leptofilum sp. TaxID=3241576 RepID=UPI003B5C0C51
MTKLISWQEFEGMDEAALRAVLAAVGEAVVAETAVFQQTTDMLSYHNQLASLIYLLQSGYTQLQTNDNASEWQQQTVTALLTDSLVFQYLQSNPVDSASAPPQLFAALQASVPIDADGLNHYLAHLSGYTQYQWQLAHLAEHPPQNMAALMIEFLAFAFKEVGVGYGRTNLIRHLLPTYFVERRTGQLNPRQDLGDLMRKGRPIPKPRPDPHPLAPDSETLRRFLAKLLNYDPVRPYAAATLFGFMPTWLRFLQARHLLTATEATAALEDLATLKPDLHSYFANLAGDDALGAAVANWPN